VVTVFGTLGFTPEKFLPSLRHHAPIDRVCVFHDADERSHEAAEEVAEHCSNIGLPCEAVEVDAFDMLEATKTIRDEVTEVDPSDVVFNITGGTAVLTCAALLTSVLEGLRAETTDLRDASQPPEALPLMTMSYKELLTDAQRNVLSAIAERNGKVSQRDLTDVLDLRKATVSHHVKSLKERGLVTGQRAEDARMEYLEVPPSADLLLEPAARDE
jgi:CRISPR locus-related DNA-binding protein